MYRDYPIMCIIYFTSANEKNIYFTLLHRLIFTFRKIFKLSWLYGETLARFEKYYII